MSGQTHSGTYVMGDDGRRDDMRVALALVELDEGVADLLTRPLDGGHPARAVSARAVHARGARRCGHAGEGAHVAGGEETKTHAAHTEALKRGTARVTDTAGRAFRVIFLRTRRLRDRSPPEPSYPEQCICVQADCRAHLLTASSAECSSNFAYLAPSAAFAAARAFPSASTLSQH